MPLEPCLVASYSGGGRQALSDVEILGAVPDRVKLTPVEAALLPAFVKLSDNLVNTLLHSLHAALGPARLRWGCLRELEEDFLGDSGGVILRPCHFLACMPSPGDRSDVQGSALIPSWGRCAGLGACEHQHKGRTPGLSHPTPQAPVCAARALVTGRPFLPCKSAGEMLSVAGPRESAADG